MDFKDLMQEINSCHTMRYMDSGELIVMEHLKGKHIFKAQKIVCKNPDGADMTRAIISLIFKVDGFSFTIEQIDELPGYIVSEMMVMLNVQLPGSEGEMCNR